MHAAGTPSEAFPVLAGEVILVMESTAASGQTYLLMLIVMMCGQLPRENHLALNIHVCCAGYDSEM